MKNIFKDIFKPNRVSQTEQYGVVVISENPEEDSGLYHEELRAMMRYSHIVKSHEMSVEEFRDIASHLPIGKFPAFALIREGIYHSESMESRLEDAIVYSAKSGEVIVMIELLGKK